MIETEFTRHLLAHTYANFCVTDAACESFGALEVFRGLSGILSNIDHRKSKLMLDEFLEKYRSVFDAWHEFYPNYDNVYESLGDDISKCTYFSIIAARMFWHIKRIPLIPKISDSEYANMAALLSEDRRNFGLLDLSKIGYNIKMDIDMGSVFLNYLSEQYRYTSEGLDIRAAPGDVVIDGGAYVGDTALYFSSLVGPSGRVISAEFIPDNLVHFRKNMQLNKTLSERISLVEHPLWSESGIELGFESAGAASAVSSSASNKYSTISIDDIVRQKNLPKVDFIKLDIEGAEVEALLGGEDTIREFKPKMGVCLYHNDHHFYQIPILLKKMNPNYSLYVRHLTSDLGETVLYAIDS